MTYLLQFIVSTISAMGFALLFSSPKRSLILAGLNAGLGWVLYKIILDSTEAIYIASFVSALVIAAISEVLARKYHFPASIFIFPGIINLAPGEAVYNTMKYFITNDNQMAIISLYKALAIAGALAFGVLLSSSFSKSLRNFRKRRANRTIYENLRSNND